ncbi:hypothetical protein HQQ81_19450 [Microbacteriaceae bacterium VKM Ac-2854]|nr:hypothetical protein [Microbacteriaceae bacterium VKM Ac-2854]
MEDVHLSVGFDDVEDFAVLGFDRAVVPLQVFGRDAPFSAHRGERVLPAELVDLFLDRVAQAVVAREVAVEERVLDVGVVRVDVVESEKRGERRAVALVSVTDSRLVVVPGEDDGVDFVVGEGLSCRPLPGSKGSQACSDVVMGEISPFCPPG